MNKKQRNIIIATVIISILILVVALNNQPKSVVGECRGEGETCSSSSDCCSNHYCVGGTCNLKDFCVPDSNLLCIDPMFNSYDPESFNCNIDSGSVVNCGSEGCLVKSGANDICKGTPGPEECNENYMECRDTKVFKCEDGQWEFKEDCINTDLKTCLNPQYNNAYCKEKLYYCYNPSENNCIWSNTKLSDRCYDTQTECENKIPSCCYKMDNDGKKYDYVYRESKCQSNELKYTYPDVTKENCENWNIGVCNLKSPEECGDGIFNLCDQKECEACGYIFEKELIGGKCYNKSDFTPKCDSCDAFALSSMTGWLWKDKHCRANLIALPPQTFTICSFSFIKYALIPIVILFSFLFLLDLLSDKIKSLKGNKKKTARIIISILLSLIAGYLTYVLFWLGLIIFIGIIILKFGKKLI